MEGTGTTDNTPSNTSSNWSTYNGVNAWGTAGAQNTTSDRHNTNLWGATTSTFNVTNNSDVTVALNASGVTVVQGWYNTPASNYGLTIQNPATSSDYLIIASSEAANSAQRPRLNINYCVAAANPTITTVGTLSAFSAFPGVASAVQSYTVSGSNLAGDIVITAPADFQVSTTSGGGFGSSVTLIQIGGTVAATPIYVRFNRATAGTSGGNITHTSTGAVQRDVAVSGTASNTVIATFQEGVSGYTGTVDTYLYGISPSVGHGSDEQFMWDTDSGGGAQYGLLRFNDIFGSNPGQIPVGLTITSAELSYVTYDEGDTANVNEVIVDWDESVTYADFGGDSGVQADEYGTLIGTASGALPVGIKVVDVTASLTAWAGNPASNRGWIFYPVNSNGVKVRSSEYTTTPGERPKLTVTFTNIPPNHAPDQPVLVQPSANATGVPTSPTLEVTVTDPESEAMTKTSTVVRTPAWDQTSPSSLCRTRNSTPRATQTPSRHRRSGSSTTGPR